MSDRRADLMPSSRWQVVEAAAVAATPWRNGGGVTRELLRVPAPAATRGASDDDWTMRVSVADIDADGPFSAFPGVERWFAVLSGAGVALSHADPARDGGAASTRVDRVTPAAEPLCFDGDWPRGCRLLDGPTRDLNVMCRRDLARARLARAHWNVAWQPRDATAGPKRAALVGAGLFSAVALVLRAGTGPARLLPAQTLAWCTHPEPSEWAIVPAGVRAAAQALADGGPPGWWITLSPVRLPVVGSGELAGSYRAGAVGRCGRLSGRLGHEA